MRRLRVVRVVVAAMTALPAVVLIPAQPSNAGLLGVTCTGGITTTSYTPGIRFEPRSAAIDVDSTLGVCISGEPGASGGIYGEHARAELSCLDLLKQGDGTRRFTWADGRTSVFSFHRRVTNTNGQMVNTFTGHISKGKFRGRSVTQVVVVNGALLGCASDTGVTSTTGIGTLRIS